MGEERYVKQIISDVMEMAAKIKFLEAKVAASESWSAECTDDHKRELAAALRRAKAEGEDELLKLRIYTQTLQRALRNCHMLARRIVVSESAFFKIDSAHHIIRMCEEAGITKDGVLREDARAAQIEDGDE